MTNLYCILFSLLVLVVAAINEPDTIPKKKQAPKIEKKKKSEIQLQMAEVNKIIYKLDSTKVDTTKIK